MFWHVGVAFRESPPIGMALAGLTSVRKAGDADEFGAYGGGGPFPGGGGALLDAPLAGSRG